MNWKTRVAASAAILTAAVVAGGLTATPALASTTAPVVSGGGLHPVAVVFSNSGSTAYVVDQNGFVNLVSTSSKKVTHQITTESAIATSGFESGGAISPDGKTLWVAVYNNPYGPQLLGYSTSTRKLVHQYSLGGQSTGAVAVSPDGTKVLVWGETTDTPEQDSLTIVTLANNSIATVGLGNAGSGQNPTAITVAPDSETAYVTTQSDGVAMVDLGTSAVTDIPTGAKPEGLAIDGTNSKLYIGESDGTIEQTTLGSDDAPSSFVVLDGFQANALSLTPVTNKYLVVAASSTSSGTGVALVFSVQTGLFVSQTTVGSSPWSVAVNPAGTTAYVGNNGDGKTSIVTLKNAAPAIASHTAPSTGTVGTPYSTGWKATGFPSPTYSSTGTLPPGVTLAAPSGVLSGTPTTAGVYKFKIVASNGIGKASSSKTQTVTIKLALAPGEPTVSGTVAKGQTLTLDPGTWGPTPVKLTYKWQRSTNGGATWKTISKATKLTYKIPSSYAHDDFQALVTGSKSGYTTVTRAGGLPV